MPFKDPDPTDPNMLVGVILPADSEATRDMAYVFAEEFARLGYTREQLLWLFKNPFYGGAHGAYQTLGENETLAIIDECLNVWGSIKISVQDVQSVQPLRSVQTPSSVLPRDAGEHPPLTSPPRRGGEKEGDDLNILNGLNDWNASDERSENDA
jgi:hypothetical protein